MIERAHYPPGTRFGVYKTIEHVDDGGFGSVYKARSDGGQIVALKLIPKGPAAVAEDLGARLQSDFANAHGMVPHVFAVEYAANELYVAMDFVESPSLAKEIGQGRLDAGRAVHCAALMCEFLTLAHRFETAAFDGKRRRGIIHADLKPQHVFITEAGIIVLDFGLAAALDVNRDDATRRAVTPRYASPERWRSSRGSKQDDLWAVGIMLYEMVAGRRPLEHLEADEPAFRRALEEDRSRASVPSSCPPGVARIIDKLLRADSRERYSSADHVLADLRAYQQGRPVGVAAEPPPTRRRPAGRVVHPPPQRPVADEPATRPRLTARGQADVETAGRARQASKPAPFPVRLRASRQRWVWMFGVLLMAGLLASEGLAGVIADQMRADLASLDAPRIPEWRRRYERLEAWTLFNAGAWGWLDRPLRTRLAALAGGVIADYRRDDASVPLRQWQQAHDGLAWAATLGRADSRIESMRHLCAGHIDRITAQELTRDSPQESQRLYTRAVDHFEQAAALDSSSADPYLGLSRVYIYGFRDIQRGSDAIARAQGLGQTPGWRESAQLGDAYWGRAREVYRTARRAPAPAQREAWEQVRESATRCIEHYQPILQRGNAQTNARDCEGWLEDANRGVSSGALARRR